MPLIETRGSGSAFAYGLTSGVALDDIFKPAGTTRVLGLSFNDGLLTRTADSTITVSATTSAPTLNASGGVVRGFASGFALGAGTSNLNAGTSLIATNLPAMNGVNYTFIAWYKGTQTTSIDGIAYTPPIPVFGDPRGSVYMGFGIDKGKIFMTEVAGSRGGPNINDGNWHMLAWTMNSSNVMNGFVDGYRHLAGKRTLESPGNNRVDYIGQGYGNSGCVAPTALDGIQIYNQILTESQLREIYSAGTGLPAQDNYVYARYWRMRIGATTTHTPNSARYLMRDKDGTDYTIYTHTADNCNDQGFIASFGGTTTWSYDAGAGNTKAMVGCGLYNVYGGGNRDSIFYLDYSSNGSTWTELSAGKIQTTVPLGCGIYMIHGVTP